MQVKDVTKRRWVNQSGESDIRLTLFSSSWAETAAQELGNSVFGLCFLNHLQQLLLFSENGNSNKKGGAQAKEILKSELISFSCISV